MVIAATVAVHVSCSVAEEQCSKIQVIWPAPKATELTTAGLTPPLASVYGGAPGGIHAAAPKPKSYDRMPFWVDVMCRVQLPPSDAGLTCGPARRQKEPP